MKKVIKNLMYTGLFSMALIFNSCQEEFEEINGGDEQETIVANSTTASLIENISTNDGSFDNIVDGASCFAINFPYTVEIAGNQITVDSIEDFRLIEEIFDEFQDDEDILELIFPITITLADFTEITIESKEALRELVAECTNGDDEDIECIDFAYPITLFTFDVNEQITGSVEINNDRELRRFFAGLEEDDIISIDFPITLIRFDGEEIVVDNNGELARALEAARDECDEDDDNDFNDDDFTEERLDALLVECAWSLREFKRNGNDFTSDFFENLLNFNEDGTVIVTDREQNMRTGTWRTNLTEDGALLILAFESLRDFNLEWLVSDIGDDKIKLFSGDENRIILKQFCEDDSNGSTDCDPVVVAENLESGCLWEIADTNFEIDFDGTIDFSNRNIQAFFSNGAFADEGNWEVTDEGLRFNAISEGIGALLGDWTIVECSETRIKLINSDQQYVILEKNCDMDESTLDSLRSNLRECEWIIRRVENQGEEINRVLGFKFKFMDEGVVTLSDGINPSEGTWEVGINEEGEIALLISLGDGAIDFDWPLRDLTNDRLKFEVAEIGYELILQRTCDDDDNDGDVTEIRDIMLGGQWNVALYDNEGEDTTENYEGLDFSFSQMNQVEVSLDGESQIEGIWRITRDTGNNLQFFINFEDAGIFGELTEPWFIVEVSENRIELVFEDEDVNFKKLVFEKGM